MLPVFIIKWGISTFCLEMHMKTSGKDTLNAV